MKGIERDIEQARTGGEIRTTGQAPALLDTRDCASCGAKFTIPADRPGTRPETCGAARCLAAMRRRRYHERLTLGRV